MQKRGEILQSPGRLRMGNTLGYVHFGLYFFRLFLYYIKQAKLLPYIVK